MIIIAYETVDDPDISIETFSSERQAARYLVDVLIPAGFEEMMDTSEEVYMDDVIDILQERFGYWVYSRQIGNLTISDDSGDIWFSASMAE